MLKVCSDNQCLLDAFTRVIRRRLTKRTVNSERDRRERVGWAGGTVVLTAALSMRQINIDFACARAIGRLGGGRQRVDLCGAYDLTEVRRFMTQAIWTDVDIAASSGASKSAMAPHYPSARAWHDEPRRLQTSRRVVRTASGAAGKRTRGSAGRRVRRQRRVRAEVLLLLESDRQAAADSFLARHAIEDAARLIVPEPSATAAARAR